MFYRLLVWVNFGLMLYMGINSSFISVARRLFLSETSLDLSKSVKYLNLLRFVVGSLLQFREILLEIPPTPQILQLPEKKNCTFFFIFHFQKYVAYSP